MQGLANAREIERDAVLETDCDILLPSALENSITLANVGASRRRSSRSLPMGRLRRALTACSLKWRLSHSRHLANAGGVTVSYYEGCRINTRISGRRAKSTSDLSRRCNSLSPQSTKRQRDTRPICARGVYPGR